MINTELYRIFYFVATYKNISKAADALFISQPAVSKSIKKLESLTNCVLFNRSPKGVTLTTEGEIVFEHVKIAFKHLEESEKIISKINNFEEGCVKVGISNTLCKYFFLPILERFHMAFPDIRIQIFNQPSPETYKLLDEAAIDFGIISIPEKKLDYSYTELTQVHDIFVSQHKYEPENKPLPLSALSDMHIMMLEKENQTRRYVDGFLAQNNIELVPEIQLGSMDFLIELAKIGIGTACVIKEFVSSELKSAALYQLPVSPTPNPRKIGIVQKENIPISLAAKRFIDFMHEEKTGENKLS